MPEFYAPQSKTPLIRTLCAIPCPDPLYAVEILHSQLGCPGLVSSVLDVEVVSSEVAPTGSSAAMSAWLQHLPTRACVLPSRNLQSARPVSSCSCSLRRLRNFRPACLLATVLDSRCNTHSLCVVIGFDVGSPGPRLFQPVHAA